MSWVEYLLIGFIVLFFVALTGFVLFLVIKVIMGEDYSILKKKNFKENLVEGEEDEILIEPNPAEFHEVKAISKRIYNQFLGVKLVKSQFWFLITFQFEDGKRQEFTVHEDEYAALVEGDVGHLIFQGTKYIEFYL